MKFPLKSTNFILTPSIKEFVSKRIEKLESLIGKMGATLSGWIEIGRVTRHHKKGDVYKAEAEVRLGKRSIRAEAIDKTVYGAVTKMKEKAEREIGKYKEVQTQKHRDWRWFRGKKNA